MDRAIFLDRDNTIIANDGDLGDPAAVELLPGAADAIAALQGENYVMVVVTNQGGVARGKFGPADVDAVHQRIADLLYQEAEATIERYYYCPFHPNGTVDAYRRQHPWRKPLPGMLLQAAADLKLNLHESWMVGDHSRDILAGKAAGVRTILLTPLSKGELPPEDRPDFVAPDLLAAARIIAEQPKKPAGKPMHPPLPPSIMMPGSRSRHRPPAPAIERVEGSAALAAPQPSPPQTAAQHEPAMLSASMDNPEVLARIGMSEEIQMPENPPGLTLDVVSIEARTEPDAQEMDQQPPLPGAQAILLDMTHPETCLAPGASAPRFTQVQLMLFPEISFMTHPPQTSPANALASSASDDLSGNDPHHTAPTPPPISAATNPAHAHPSPAGPTVNAASHPHKAPSLTKTCTSPEIAGQSKPSCARPAPLGIMAMAAGLMQIAVISLALLALLTVGNPTKFFQCISAGILLQLMAGAFWMLDRNCCR